MLRFLWLYVFFSVMFLPVAALAVDCTTVFPDGASSTNSSGEILFDWGASVTGSPDNILNTSNLYDNSGGSSCGSTACSSDTNYATAVNFSSFPGGSNVYLGYQEKLTLAPGDYRQMSLGNESELTLQSGVYTFSFGVSTQSGAKILLEPGATVALYSARTISIGFSTVNVPDNGDLLMYSTRVTQLNSGATINAFIYSEANVTIENGVVLTGSVTSEATITLRSGASIVYEQPGGSTTFTNFCEGSGGGATLDSFSIDIGSGTASTCSPQSVLISALDADGQVLPDYAGTVDLSTTSGHGTWSTTGVSGDSQGTLSGIGADTGVAQYQFDAGDAGTVTLNLSNARAESLQIGVSGDGISSQSGLLTFADNIFSVASSDSLGDDLIAGRSHSFVVQMLKKDPATGNCGVATDYQVAQIKAWITPSGNDPGGTSPQLTNGNASQTIQLPTAEPGSTQFSANFVNGQANFSLQASDIGEYTVQFKDASGSFAAPAITGGSATLVARPFAIDLSVAGNPAASQASEGVFKAAGEAFSVTARAVGWQLEDDADLDGVADGHDDTAPAARSDLSNNPSLASFGQEGESVVLTAALNQPSGGVNAGLLSTAALPTDGRILTSFSGGQGGTSQVAYGEVGIVELYAVLNDSQYLSASTARTQKIVGASGYVGRFIPSYFLYQADASPITPFCSASVPFSYLSQPFGVAFNAIAKNTQGATTQNYVGEFWRLNQASQISLGVKDTDGTDYSSRGAISGTLIQSTSGIVSASVDFQIDRLASPDGPFPSLSLGINVVDADSVTWLPGDLDLDVDGDGGDDMVSLGSTYLKYGRLEQQDAFGPETHNLPVVLEVQYWDGADWLINLDDSCSTLLLSDISYPDGTIDVSGNKTVAVGSGSTTGNYGVENLTSVGFQDGDAQHYFTAPGMGNTGDFAVSVSLANRVWLQYDWNQDGAYTDSSMPTAKHHFGIYRGHDRVLYLREVLP